jgi:hypothetical protein
VKQVIQSSQLTFTDPNSIPTNAYLWPVLSVQNMARRQEYTFTPAELSTLQILSLTIAQTGLTKQSILADGCFILVKDVAPDLLKRNRTKQSRVCARLALYHCLEAQSAADAALRGMEVLAAGNDLPGFTPTNTQLPFGEMMGQSMTFLPTSRGLIEKTARLIYADKVQKNGYTEFEENAWKMSIQEAAGFNGEFGGIQMVGAVATLIPTDITAEQFNKAMDNLDLLTIKDYDRDAKNDRRSIGQSGNDRRN